LGDGRGRLVLPSVVELPKVNGLEVLWRLRDDERTKALPLLVPTSADPPYPLNDRGVGVSIWGPLTSDKFEEPAQRLGLRRQITNRITDEDSPEYIGPRS
jgi:hypothetical protein